MGKLRAVGITELRLYDDPKHPETSDYDVGLPITVPEAVIDPESGKSLSETLEEIVTDISKTQKSDIPKHNADPDSHPDIRNMINDLRTRVIGLEVAAGGSIDSNEFSVGFGDLDNLIVDGVWNIAESRLEF